MTERVTGIGGVFIRSRDPEALAAWYREHLGVPVAPDGTYGVFPGGDDGSYSVWSTFPADTKHFGDGPSTCMINYRVSDLDAMLAQLRAAGVWVSDDVQDGEYGKFGWAADPEGTRFELWQPPAGEPSSGG